jgi:hypothetical protein
MIQFAAVSGIMKPGLQKLINKLFHVFHEVLHRFCLFDVVGSHQELLGSFGF